MKLDRLVAIIMILNNRERVTARELSEKFQVSIKTIQRDMEIIERAGVPIVSFKGNGGGYGIIEEFKVNNSSMTKEEAALVNKLLKGINNSYENIETIALINKLEGLKKNENGREDRLIIDFSKWGRGEGLNKIINIIDKAILNRNPIKFQYVNGNGESTERIIEPYKIIFKSLSWYVYGFCTLKNEMRIFKVTRIKNIKVCGEQFELKEIIGEDVFKEKDYERTEIELRFKDNFKGIILESFEEYEELKEENGYTIAVIKIPYSNWVEGMILSFGDNVEVIKPTFLRDNIKEKLEKMINLYK
ncbi:MAG: YafY family protein [Clostridium sp.]|nr:YafY family protein [Clostridium sp.]MDU7084139.1 YafY family protein [Clostridium sp.]